MPKLKPRYLFPLIAIIILTGTWTARIHITELVASSILESKGLSETHIDIRKLDTGHSHIAEISLSAKTDSGLIRLVAHDLDISYKLQQLAQGRLETLVVGEIELSHMRDSALPQLTENAATVAEPIKLLAILRQAIREYVIIDTFTVERILMQGEYAGILRNKPLHLKGNNNAGITSAVFTLLEPDAANQAKPSSQLVISSLSQDGLSAELKLGNTDGNLPAELQLNINDTAINGRFRINSGELVRWLQPFSNLNGLATEGEIDATASLDLTQDREITATLSAASDKLVVNALHTENVIIKLSISLPGAATEPVKLTGGSFVQSDQIAYRETRIDNARINLSGELSGPGDERLFTGKLDADRLALIHDSRKLSLQEIRSTIRLDKSRISSEGTFSTSSPHGNLVYRAAHGFGDHAGALSIQTTDPFDLNGERTRLSRILTPWPYAFDLYTGTIQLATQASWNKENRLQVSAAVKLEDSGGNYGELVFSGLSFEHNLYLLPAVISKEASTIRIKHIDSGVTASNVRANLKLIQAETGVLPQLVVTDLEGDIFDGTFSADDLVYDFNLDKNSFTLKAEDIDLAQVVETQQLRDISVSGRIDGTLPVEIDDAGISVKQGVFLNNIRAGTIRYNPTSGADQLKQNPLTGVALDALRDFRYSHLSANVNYTPQGMLKIDLQLKGTSPELDTKRPVHLNINTEQNLLSLLKSLRYAEGVSAVIDKRVRRQYESHRNHKAE